MIINSWPGSNLVYLLVSDPGHRSIAINHIYGGGNWIWDFAMLNEQLSKQAQPSQDELKLAQA